MVLIDNDLYMKGQTGIEFSREMSPKIYFIVHLGNQRSFCFQVGALEPLV